MLKELARMPRGFLDAPVIVFRKYPDRDQSNPARYARAIALRGMLEYARIAGDHRVAEFVRRSYEFTLTQGIPRTGWINCYPAALNGVEGCALGDLAALAIRLSDYGLGDYWDDVDALARNQLVEQQFIRPDILQSISNSCTEKDACEKDPPPGKLCYDNVIERSIGVYGGVATPTAVPGAWVMHCCTSNATQGLYAVWEGTLRENGDTAIVNLLLNRAGRLADVDSWLPFEGRVVVRVKSARRLAVRLPAWIDERGLRIQLSGRPIHPPRIGRYMLFEDLHPRDTIELAFPVSETTASYTVNAHSPAEQVYNCTFRASTLVDISPRDQNSTSYPLYQRHHLRTASAPMKRVTRFVPSRVVRQW